MKKFTLFVLASLIFTGLFAQILNVELGNIPATAESQCTGKVWVNVTGGEAPYSFHWNNDAVTTYQENLCLGTYSVTVTDALNATAVAEVVFSTSSQIIIPLNGYENITPSLYGQCDGTVTIYAYNGIEPYTYQIFNATTGVMILQTNTTNNLCSGNYYAVATDANGGIYFHSFTVGAEFIRALPSQFQWSYPIGMPVSFYVAGVPPFTVNITSPSSATQSYSIDAGTEQIEYTALEYGNHLISLSDAEGHTAEQIFCAYDQNNLMNINVTSASNGCDGMVTTPNPVNISMNYETSPGTFQTLFIENGTLCPGEYMVMVQDIMCPGVMNMAPITITGPVYDYPVVEVGSSNTIYNLCTGMAWLDVTGGTVPYEYNWINYSNTTDFINNLCSGNLFVKVTDAANVWSYGYTYIESDLPETVPGDTLSASQEECISDITNTYIYAYTVNPSNVMVTWAIEHGGMITYLEVTYNYVITLPGVYNVELVLYCDGGKSISYFVTELDIAITGIKSNKLNDVNIYPNPVQDNLYVSFNENVRSLEIMSITGAVISNNRVIGTLMSFDVSELSEGVYLIRFTNNDGTSFIEKFVK